MGLCVEQLVHMAGQEGRKTETYSHFSPVVSILTYQILFASLVDERKWSGLIAQCSTHFKKNFGFSASTLSCLHGICHFRSESGTSAVKDEPVLKSCLKMQLH